jgi:hypothetical protein
MTKPCQFTAAAGRPFLELLRLLCAKLARSTRSDVNRSAHKQGAAHTTRLPAGSDVAEPAGVVAAIERARDHLRLLYAWLAPATSQVASQNRPTPRYHPHPCPPKYSPMMTLANPRRTTRRPTLWW